MSKPAIMFVVPLLASYLALVSFGWTGFLGSDDAAYAAAGLQWISHFPYLGQDHWALRHTLVLQIALAFKFLGVGELSLSLPSIVGTFLIALIFYAAFSHRIGAGKAALLTTLMMSVPLVTLSSSTADIDIQECLFCVLSVLSFDHAIRKDRVWYLLLAGVAAGLAFVSRETSVALILFYGILFLIGYRMPRQYYFIMGAAFFTVIGSEMLFYLVNGRSLFYRLDISHRAVHGSVNPVNRAAQNTGSLFDSAGNITIGAIFDPVLMMLFNHNFGIIFWLFVPATIWVFRDKHLNAELRQLLLILSGLSLTWFVFISINSWLYLIARYMYVSAVCAAVVVGTWLLVKLRPSRPLLAAVLLSGVLLGNLAGIYFDNKNFRFPERALVRLARQEDAVIYTDPETSLRAGFLLRVDGVSDRVSEDPVPPGGLFYYVPANVEHLRAVIRVFNQADYRPRQNYRLIATFDPGRRLIVRVLDSLKLTSMIPTPILEKLDPHHEAGFLYRVPL
jgi:4-amino-4-deoxy-L-arabinose transferase-like glycosyltransferase